jgi:DNA polymerase-4
MERYVAISKAASEIYKDYTPKVEPFGLDENYMDVTDADNSGIETAETIRNRIKRELGITVSIGVSYNRVFAKMASENPKIPDFVSCVNRDDYKEKLWPLPVSKLYFVGAATTKKLNWDCIYTVGDLAKADPKALKRRLGVNGEVLWRYANGEDSTAVSAAGWQAPIKTIGNSTTTSKDLTTPEEIRIITMLLSESVAERMRDKGFKCRTVQVWIRYNDMSSFQHQAGLPFPCCTAQRIGQSAVELILKNRRENRPIRSLGVRACNLLEDDHPQLSFLPEREKEQRQERLEETIHSIRRRFGHFTIERGIMLADRRLSGLDTQNESSSQSIAFFRGER